MAHDTQPSTRAPNCVSAVVTPRVVGQSELVGNGMTQRAFVNALADVALDQVVSERLPPTSEVTGVGVRRSI
jgi:hypothetical protein